MPLMAAEKSVYETLGGTSALFRVIVAVVVTVLVSRYFSSRSKATKILD